MTRPKRSYEHLAQLVVRAQAGDRAAFDEIYRLTAQVQLFNIAAKAGPEAADDLLQEVYLATWNNIDKVQPRALVGYLSAVRRNVLLAYYEKAGRSRETAADSEELAAAGERTDREPAGEHEADPAVVADAHDELARLSRALREDLNDDEREMVTMRFYQDLPIAAIAESFQVSESTVKRTIRRALGKLRDKLGVLPASAAFAEMLERVVADPPARGAFPRAALHRKPLEGAVRAMTALSVAAVIGCGAFAAVAHNAPDQPPIAETIAPEAAAPGASTPTRPEAPADTTAPVMASSYSDAGGAVLRFTDDTGVAEAWLIDAQGARIDAEAVQRAEGDPREATYRFAVENGTYRVCVVDRYGNEAAGTVTVDIPPLEPEPYGTPF